MKHLKFLTTSLVIFGAGTIINCYCMESEQLINNSDELSSDERCYKLMGPILTFSQDPNLKNYSKCEPMKCTIKYLVEVCKQNNALVLGGLMVAFATICNKIVSSLFYGSQIDDKLGDYTKATFLLDDLSNSAQNLSSNTFGDEPENHSVTTFNKDIINKNIKVSSNFLKELKETTDGAYFKIFDNPNYLKYDINLVKFFKYLGNRILQLARNEFNNMYNKVHSSNFSNSEDKTKYLEKSFFDDIILPFYYKLSTIKDNLYNLSNNIEKYIKFPDNFPNSNKEVLQQQLKSTADYLEDVLINSGIRQYEDYFKQKYQLHVKKK